MYEICPRFDNGIKDQECQRKKICTISWMTIEWWVIFDELPIAHTCVVFIMSKMYELLFIDPIMEFTILKEKSKP